VYALQNARGSHYTWMTPALLFYNN